MELLVKRLVDDGYGVYLTDTNKFFVHDHKTTDQFSASHTAEYAEILKQEIAIVNPSVIVCLGRRAERMCKRFGISYTMELPHLSGTARGAMTRRFERLAENGATAENIADEYARHITEAIH